jgi:hypothetical protein
VYDYTELALLEADKGTKLMQTMYGYVLPDFAKYLLSAMAIAGLAKFSGILADFSDHTTQRSEACRIGAYPFSRQSSFSDLPRTHILSLNSHLQNRPLNKWQTYIINLILAGRGPMLRTAETSPQFGLYSYSNILKKCFSAIYDLCPYITRHNCLFLHSFRFG